MNMRRKYLKKRSLIRTLIYILFTILIISSFGAFILMTNIMPLSSSAYAAFDSETKINVFRIFQTYNFFSLTFTLTVNAIFISFIVNKMLKPIRALTEGTKKVAQGDFNVEIPVVPDKRDELSALTESFNTMARELSFISMLNNDFINNVSHEFKTPISSIQGFATVLLGTDLTDEQREYAEIISHESARLTRLTSNILKLTKLENQVIITDKETFFLDEQIRHSILLFQNEWTKKNIDMNIDLSPVTYTGDPELIQQIWHNLLSNAIKFTNENGQITVKCREENGKAVVSVKDSGSGMDRSTVTRIFDKFYQGDKSHSGEGNGLGLALVNRIAELCNGTVDVKSELGKGSEFIVSL